MNTSVNPFYSGPISSAFNATTLALKERVANEEKSPLLAVVQHFRKGEFVFQQGDKSDRLFKLAKGFLAVGTLDENGEESFMHFVFEGEYFGEEVLLAASTRQVFALVLSQEVTVESYSISALPAGNFINDILKETMLLKVRRMQQTIQLKQKSSLKERLIFVLKEIGSSFGVSLLNGEILIRAKLKHRELALLVAATRQSVTTQLLQLVDDGLVKVDKNSLLLTHQFLK